MNYESEKNPFPLLKKQIQGIIHRLLFLLNDLTYFILSIPSRCVYVCLSMYTLLVFNTTYFSYTINAFLKPKNLFILMISLIDKWSVRNKAGVVFSLRLHLSDT